MKSLLILIVLLFCSFLNAQNLSSEQSTSSSYINYSTYKKAKKEGKMEIDSIGFRLNNNDTLIRVTGFILPKGINVEYEQKDSIFLETYKNLVYNKLNFSKQKSSKNTSTMKIWKDEIRVYFDTTVTYKNKKELIKFMKFLDKEIDSLKIKVVSSKEKSNYFIYYLNKPTDIDWDNRIKTNDGCYISWNGKQELYNCTMKLNAQIIYNEKEQLMLMKKHFVWSLGYFSLLDDRDCKSLLSKCISLDKELTTEDLELLKYHYSYGICKGTNLETFEDNHKRAKNSLKSNTNGKFYFYHTTN